MKAKKVMALVLCAAMVSGLAATTVMAAPEDQFEGLTANEAYEFPMIWLNPLPSPACREAKNYLKEYGPTAEELGHVPLLQPQGPKRLGPDISFDQS
ncbi:MAG: hypothetical protein ACLRZ5_18810 [Ruminococcus sp.]